MSRENTRNHIWLTSLIRQVWYRMKFNVLKLKNRYFRPNRIWTLKEKERAQLLITPEERGDVSTTLQRVRYGLLNLGNDMCIYKNRLYVFKGFLTMRRPRFLRFVKIHDRKSHKWRISEMCIIHQNSIFPTTWKIRPFSTVIRYIITLGDLINAGHFSSPWDGNCDSNLMSHVEWENNRVLWGGTEHIFSAEFCDELLYISSLWIWKGVSATWQSGRYTLLYPKGRYGAQSIWWSARTKGSNCLLHKYEIWWKCILAIILPCKA